MFISTVYCTEICSKTLTNLTHLGFRLMIYYRVVICKISVHMKIKALWGIHMNRMKNEISVTVMFLKAH